MLTAELNTRLRVDDAVALLGRRETVGRLGRHQAAAVSPLAHQAAAVRPLPGLADTMQQPSDHCQAWQPVDRLGSSRQTAWQTPCSSHQTIGRPGSSRQTVDRLGRNQAAAWQAWQTPGSSRQTVGRLGRHQAAAARPLAGLADTRRTLRKQTVPKTEAQMKQC